MKDKRFLHDIILIGVMLLVSLLVWGIVKFTQKDGGYVLVKIDGELAERYSLDSDTRVEIKTDDGHINVLVISNGKAYIESADCPDKLCVKQHPISKAGESIICLPHKLVIVIEGESEVDAIS